MTDDPEPIIRAFIVESFLFGLDEDLGSGEKLLEKRILDSTGILEIAEFLRQTWQIPIDDEEMLPENFGSLRFLADFVQRKRHALAAGT